jgi:hypothetical protein
MTTTRVAAGLLATLASTAALALSTQAWSQDYFLEELLQWQKPSDRNDWYQGTQGSRLMPAAWLRSLEQPGTTALFLEPNYVRSFGYLSPGPNGLPVGFVQDTGPDDKLQRTKLRWRDGQGSKEAWIGLNCSACHTSQFSFRGTTFRIDGGSATADFQGFMKSLNMALLRTRDDPAKWSRFAHRVLNGPPTAAADAKLRGEFDKLIAWQLAEARINDTTSEYGPGRVDAFGRIYNKVALLLGGPDAKGNPPDAPVCIPFIWHAPRRSSVQYNGIAPKIVVGNTDIGAVARNTGEVIGVFGDVIPHGNPGLLNGFVSSVKVEGLMGLEETLAKLMPPRWPEKIFNVPGAEPKIDEKERARRVEKGKALYATECAHCHALTSRDPNPKNRIDLVMNLFNPGPNPPKGTRPEKLDTDPWMACNAYAYSASSGPLTGFKGDIISGGKAVPAEAPLGFLLRITVVSTLLNQKGALVENSLRQWIGLPVRPVVEGPPTVAAAPLTAKERQLKTCMEADPYANDGEPHLGYTSRPLNGIWASPPYLHNGSVPTMYDLLLPAAKRPKSFFLGTSKYDPKNMGFETAPSQETWFEFRTTGADGKPIDGNSNAGHDYGNSKFSDDDRYAIIEYLKTL